MANTTIVFDTPGTVQLVNTQGALQHRRGQVNIVLVPRPSGDPNDPLSWMQKRKTVNIFWAMTWCFFAAAIISGLSPAYLQIEADTGISVADLSTGNGLLFLFLGWGTLLTQNLALNYGRRPTLVLSMVAMTFINLWSAYTKSRADFFINRIVMGIVSSPMETLIEVVIDDLFFVHQRGFYMGLYSWTLWCGALLCPVAAGFVAETLGWRWIQYILSILGGAISVATFLFFEETMFHRSIIQAEITGIVTTGHRCFESSNIALDTPPSEIKNPGPEEANLEGLNTINSEVITAPAPQCAEQSADKTFRSKLKLWGYHNSRKSNRFKHALLPFELLRFPSILFAGVLVGGILSWYNVVGGSLALILGNAPYNFGSSVIGLFYLASVIGVSVGCLISSWASDALSVWMASRNRGVMEPEHRLWLGFVAIVAHPAGCILYGVGASYGIHWTGIAFGLGIISATLPLGTSLAFTYILDSFKEVAGEGFVSAIMIRNSMGFAFSYAVVPMINSIGLRDSFILTAALGVAFWALCLTMIYFGKHLRRSAAQQYWKLVEGDGVFGH
ncbi:MFS general substrate transporter [Colletotrichum tofieldiae]|uniref:MFS general substrate transporter n=1 Tax=Colletotrichum tofieldiae TaxID=708197 RepID=A0A166MGQ1_9PEZI|nr:MFS general substrate transporter [Colletotrichum tofieldiae]GKT63026.1 MFS general substrate transporter [Colletotrichum tofieldiae]GKT72959.1 MFS general substrate transporter [Colletotrichum tofieldiae]GKT89192.1 MFS general substrate transporter [Colletotrichum tofieldiae]